DLNVRYDVTGRIVTPFCSEVLAGEHWWPVDRWLTARAWLVIPAGFTPLGATPIEDFNRKFVSARYVVDPGTNQERTYSFPSASVLRTGLTVGDFDISSWLAEFSPIAVGHHVLDLYITLSAEHWDGLGLDPAGDRLPAGETFYDEYEFDVVVP